MIVIIVTILHCTTLMILPVEVVAMMTVCPSTPVLTNDVSCVLVSSEIGAESSEMLPTSGLLRCALDD